MSNKLIVRWSKKLKDFVIVWPRSGADGRLACHAFFVRGFRVGDKSFYEELKSRGYDMTTMKFSIDLRPDIASLPVSMEVASTPSQPHSSAETQASCPSVPAPSEKDGGK